MPAFSLAVSNVAECCLWQNGHSRLSVVCGIGFPLNGQHANDAKHDERDCEVESPVDLVMHLLCLLFAWCRTIITRSAKMLTKT